MYLTKEEFIILQSIKEGKGREYLKETYGITLYTNDPRIEALCQKYGIKGCNYRKELTEKADLNKVEITDAEKMPYYDYDEEKNLVKKIPVRKTDVIRLLKTFDNLRFNDEQQYYLQYGQDGLGFSLDLIDKNNNKHPVCRFIDGEYFGGEDF